MLHHHDGIPLVAQFLERCDKLAVVPLVQAYARLVQNVEDVHQFGPYLGGEPYPLALSS